MSDEATTRLWSAIQDLQVARESDEINSRQKRQIKTAIADIDQIRVEIKRNND
jgi:hypothetical protein